MVDAMVRADPEFRRSVIKATDWLVRNGYAVLTIVDGRPGIKLTEEGKKWHAEKQVERQAAERDDPRRR